MLTFLPHPSRTCSSNGERLLKRHLLNCKRGLNGGAE